MLSSVAGGFESADMLQSRKPRQTPTPQPDDDDENGCSLVLPPGAGSAPVSLLSSALATTSMLDPNYAVGRGGVQFGVKMAKSPHRKNRVLEAFPAEIFGSGTLRKEFFLPLRIADAARATLESRPPPYIKMVNPLNIHALALRHTRIMQMRQSMKTSDSQDPSSLAGHILEAGDRLINVLRKYNGLCIEKFKLSLGIAMIDYVKEGCHSRDTSFFLLYMLSGDSSCSEEDYTMPANSATPETASDGSDKSRVKQEEKLGVVGQKLDTDGKTDSKVDAKCRWMKGTEPGKWFVFAVVDIIEMPHKRGDALDRDPEPRITVDTDNLERIASEYGRYLLKKDVPPRTDSELSLRPRRGRKPKRMSPRNSTDSIPSGKKNDDEHSSSDGSDDGNASPSKAKIGIKRNSKPRDSPESKRQNVSPSTLDGVSSLESTCRMLVSLHSPKVTSAITAAAQQPLPPSQQSPVFAMPPTIGAVQNPPVLSLPQVSAPQDGQSSFIGTAGRTNGMSFFRLTPASFIRNDVATIATMSPSIIAANPSSASPQRTLLCFSPNMSPLLAGNGQSMFRSPYFYSSPSLTNGVYSDRLAPEPVVMNSSLVLDAPVQTAQMPPAPTQFNAGNSGDGGSCNNNPDNGGNN